VASFDPFCLRWFRRRAPLLPRCQISCDFRDEPLAPWTKAALRHMTLNGVSRPHFIAYDVRCLPCPCVARRRHAGLAIVGWTVRSRREMARAAPYCDNFIFERCPTGTPAIAGPRPLAYNPPGLFGRIA